jgi:hypothetical protein
MIGGLGDGGIGQHTAARFFLARLFEIVEEPIPDPEIYVLNKVVG